MSMTAEEFAVKQTEEFDAVKMPEEFRGALSYLAYEQGHSSGYQECIYYLTKYVDAIKEPLKKYTARIKGENKP